MYPERYKKRAFDWIIKMSSAEENSGRWTSREQALFIEGLKKFGRSWKKISLLIETRSADQVRSHAQKYELRLKQRPFHEVEKRVILKKDIATQYGEGVFLPGYNFDY